MQSIKTYIISIVTAFLLGGLLVYLLPTSKQSTGKLEDSIATLNQKNYELAGENNVLLENNSSLKAINRSLDSSLSKRTPLIEEVINKIATLQQPVFAVPDSAYLFLKEFAR